MTTTTTQENPMRHTFTLRRTESGVTSTMEATGRTRDAARAMLETYLFRTAQRGYTITD